MNLNNISEQELLQLADDMVANFTNMNAQNYTQFIDSRDRYKQEIHELIRSIYQLKTDVINTHQAEYFNLRIRFNDFLEEQYKIVSGNLKRQLDRV